MSDDQRLEQRLNLLRLTQRRAPVRFDLVALNVDQGFPGFRADLIEDQLAREGYTYEMRSARINLTVKEKIKPGETFCSLCARLRRGALYKYADELGCNKIALGHHADDFIETLLLNLFFNGQIKGMHPRLRATNGRHTVIRPKRSLLGAMGRVDLGTLPIPARRGARPGDRLPVLTGAAGLALAGALAPGDEAG